MGKRIGIWAPFLKGVGTEAAMINYATALHDLGYELMFFELGNEYSTSPALRKRGFDTVSITPPALHFVGKNRIFDGRERAILAFFLRKRLEKALIEQKIDLLFCGLISGVPLSLAKRTGIPMVVTVQGPPKIVYKDDLLISRLENLWRQRIWTNHYPNARHIVTISDYTKSKLAEAFPALADRLITIVNPLFDAEPKLYNPGKTDKQNRNLVFVGRSDPGKGTGLVLDLCALANEKKPNLNFHIYGEMDSAWKRKFAPFPKAYLHGYVPNLWQNLPPNAIHIVPSKRDDFSHAYLEGLAHAVPTIIAEADTPDFHHAVEVGLTTSPRNPDSLLKAIMETDFPEDKRKRIARKVASDHGHKTFRKRIKEVLK